MEKMVRRLGVLALALVVLDGCGNRPAQPAPSAGASLPDPANQLPFGTLTRQTGRPFPESPLRDG